MKYKMSKELSKLVEDLSALSVVEAAELSKALEEKWGVSAVAPVAAVAAQATEAPAAEKSEFDVILKSDNGKKIPVIKEVRALTNLNLQDAKALVEGAPKPVKTAVNKEEAEKIKAALEGAGATVELS